MASYKEQGFQERAALAAKAKQAALDKLRAKPPVDEAVLAERRAAALAKEQALAEASAAKKAAREQAAAEKKAAREQAAAEAQAKAEAEAEAKKPYQPKILSAAEMKAARDARYAARKARAGR